MTQTNLEAGLFGGLASGDGRHSRAKEQLPFASLFEHEVALAQG